MTGIDTSAGELLSKLPHVCKYEDCESPREGSTDFCASHNSILRRIARDLKKPVKPATPLRRMPVQKISEKQIDITQKLNEVYEMMDAAAREEGGGWLTCSAYPMLNERDMIMDHSHTISRARCKQLGKPELIYDPANIEHLSRQAHNEWDAYSSAMIHHANWQKRMDYIKLHDQHDYDRRMLIWAEHNPTTTTI